MSVCECELHFSMLSITFEMLLYKDSKTEMIFRVNNTFIVMLFTLTPTHDINKFRE